MLAWNGTHAFSDLLPMENLTKTRQLKLEEYMPEYYSLTSSALQLDVEKKLKDTHDEINTLYGLWKEAGGKSSTKWWKKVKSIMKVETNTNHIQGIITS